MTIDQNAFLTWAERIIANHLAEISENITDHTYRAEDA